MGSNLTTAGLGPCRLFTQSLKIIGEIFESAAFWYRGRTIALTGDGGDDVTKGPEMTDCVISTVSISGMIPWGASVFKPGLAGPGCNLGYKADRKVANWQVLTSQKHFLKRIESNMKNHNC